MKNKFTVISAHYWRQCHPETCRCPTDFVVLEDDSFYMDVRSREDGELVIALAVPKEFIHR